MHNEIRHGATVSREKSFQALPPIFLQSCETKSGTESLGSRLLSSYCSPIVHLVHESITLLVDVATYTVCRRDRNRHGGGMMLILKSDISVVRREDLETDCELLWTEIIKDSSSIMLGVFYRPPGSGYSPLSELHHSLLSIPDTHRPMR